MGNVYLDTNSKLWNEYKVWIMRHELRMPAKECKMYSDLISFLHNFDFFPPSPKDVARAEDGLEMRVIFLEENNLDDIRFHHNPKVLEVLAALAQRMEIEFVGDPSNPEPYKIFLDILKNLRILLKGTFDIMRTSVCLNEWIDGDIPTFVTKKEPKKKDIWSQMQMYIHENYS